VRNGSSQKLANNEMDVRHEFGLEGERLVAAWLVGQGVRVIAVRWRCRSGEIDLVACRGREVRFVEVKARSAGSWDCGGLEAIGAAKRRRLCNAAGLFLRAHPQVAGFDCRFDVALVERTGAGEVRLREYLAGAFGCEE
jgi:putative endonuclease